MPFRGEHQAGIITPAQDRLHFVALDVTTDDRARRSSSLLRRWTAAAERMTAGAEATPGGAVNRNPDAPPTDTGEALGLPASALTLTFGFGASLFDKLGLGRATPPGSPTCRRSRSTDSTRRSPAATSASRPARTTRRSPCTRCATWCAWASARRRCAGRSSASGGPSSTSTTQADPAQPVRLQGRHPQPQGRGHRPRSTSTSGCRPATGPAWLAGGTLPRGAPDPDAHRDLGPHVAGRAGAAHRPAPRARARRSGRPDEFDTPTTPRRPDGQPVIDATRTSGSPRRRTLAACGSCAAATTSSTAATGWATSTRACSSSRSCATPSASSCRCRARWPRNDEMMEYIEHTGSAVFAVPPGLGEGAYWGQSLLEG